MGEELTVTQFNERVGSLVSNTDSIRNLSVVGEISGITRSSAGHVYFSLKDKDSAVRCTLFRFAFSRIGFELKEGMKVVAFGGASYYVKGGSFGFNIESMAPYGKGDLQKKLEELTAKLLAEGLFDADRKREVPRYPRVIGVVTSPTGAVIKDIIDTTARRFPVDILLAPSTVQGDDAPKSIISGIERLNAVQVDVIIVGRGGGSKEDLSAFNDEGVVRAVASSKVPVISAVGHATDKTLVDRAADRYAETPTAAAMIATPDALDEGRNVSNLILRAKGSIDRTLGRMKARFEYAEAVLSPKRAEVQITSMGNKLDRLAVNSDNMIRDMLSSYGLRLDRLEHKLEPKYMMEGIHQNMMSLDDVSSRCDRAIDDYIEAKSNKLERFDGKLSGLDPTAVLGRGYTMIKDRDGKVITSISMIDVDDEVTIMMKDGRAVATVKEVKR
ncbi:MAG: exodeoxyribonuclease VII large subunit [Candidatus Methanomethylophilaceae archaeon]|nr:exodeoxyribonuclease VII large subunit [Candidatus Methanomethylophilaceae archaeon]